MSSHDKKRYFSRSVLLGALTFTLLSLLTQLLVYQQHTIHKREEQAKISEAARVARDQLQNALYHSLSATKTLAFIVVKYGVPSDFNGIAQGLIESNKYIDAIELVQGGVITHVYPLRGNEKAIGYNILKDSARNKEALQAIAKRDLFFAGPLDLKQGGVGVVGRQPIFRNGRFFGFSVVLIKLETLFRAAGIQNDKSGFSYKLSRVNPDTGREEFFSQNGQAEGHMQYVSVSVPNGVWRLYAGLPGGYPMRSLWPFIIAGFLFSLMGGFFVYYISRAPELLARRINEKAVELLNAENRYGAVFENTMYALLLSRPDGTILEANQAACSLFGYSAEVFKTIGRQGILDTGDRLIADALHERERSGRVQGEVTAIRSNGEKFPAEFSSVLFENSVGEQFACTVISDISERKTREREMGLLINNTEESFILLDKELRITGFNNQFYRLYRDYFSTEIRRGASILDYALPERRALLRELYTRVLAGSNETSELTVDTPLHGKKIIRVRYSPARDDDGEIVGVFVTASDVTEQRQREKQIEQTQRVLKRIWDSSLDIICTIDERGKFIEVSAAAGSVWGYQPDEVSSHSFTEFIHPDDLQITTEMAREIITGKDKANFSNRYIRKDGSVAFMLWSAHWDTDDRVMYCVAKDVTESRLSHEKILQSEQRFKTLVQDGSDLIGILDSDGTYIYVSPTSATILSIEPEEFIGENAFSFVHPDDLGQVMADFRRLENERRIILKPFRFRDKKGEWRWMETTITDLREDPAINGIVTNSRDITTRIEAEEKLRSSEEKYRYLFSNNPAPMFIWDFHDLAIVDCNEEALLKYGYNREEFLSLTLRDIRPEEDIAMIEAATVSPEVYGQVHKKVWRHRKKTGEIMFMEITGHVIDYANRKMVIVHLNDITERLEAENELVLSNERYNYVTRATSEAIWDWDLASDIIFLGEGFITQFAHSAAGMQCNADTWMRHIHPDDLDAVRRGLLNVIAGNEEKWSDEYRYVKDGGETVFVSNRGFVIRDRQGKAIRVVGAMQDISKRKKEEQQLRLLESVVTNANDAIIITDAPLPEMREPKIVYVNHSFTKMTGYQPGEVIGRTPAFLQGSGTSPEELHRLKRSMALGEACELTVINYRKNGTEFWNNFSVSPVADSDGNISHFIAIERDVTERVNKEKQQGLLSEISRIFNEPHDFLRSLELVLGKITTAGNYTLAECWMVDKDLRTIQLASKFSNDEGAKRFYEMNSGFRQLGRGEGLPGAVWDTGRIMHWKAPGPDEVFIRGSSAREAGLEMVSGIPLFYNKSVVGVLLLGCSGDARPQFELAGGAPEFGSRLGVEIMRKQIEQELSQVFTLAPDVICISDFEGNFKKINPAASAIFGYHEEELLGMTYPLLVHPDDRENTVRMFAGMRAASGVVYFENRNITPTGRITWLAWTLTASPVENLVFAIGKDITEIKNLQSLLENATGLARIGAWELNIRDNGDGMYWSPMTREILEVDEDYNPSLTAGFEFYYPESKEAIEKAVENLVMHNESFDLELLLRTAKGNDRWVRCIGQGEYAANKCVRIFGSFQDIHVRKIAEIKALELYREKNLILESIGDGFFAVNVSWIVTYWNNQAERLLGVRAADIVNKNLWEVFTSQKDSVFFSIYQRAMQTQETVHFEEYYDERDMWVEVSVFPTRHGLSVYFKDISLRKRSEEQLSRLNTDLVQKARELQISNAELEQFAYVASHDLQEPLRMVSSFLTQLEKKYKDVLDDKAKQYIFFAVDGAKRMRRIILDLLEFSRVGRSEDKLELIDLNGLVDEIKALLNNRIEEKRASVSRQDLPLICAPRSPLFQVFQNLIENALKYNESEQPLVLVGADDLGTHWRFSVRDNGLGISPEYFDRIFIIFQRLHQREEYSGTGMGLAIVKKIVENLGGRVWVESEENQGSTFYFTILKSNDKL